MAGSQNELSPLGEAALCYADRGIKIFPLYGIVNGCCECGRSCKSPGKHPRVKTWQQEASNDREVIGRWWARWPNANIGLPTGSTDGFTVLDFDPRHGGDLAYDDWTQAYAEFRNTWLVITGGGGWHVYFQNTDVGCSANKLAKGVDVRGRGGYVVAPPSLHVSGKSYEWEASSQPDNQDLAAFPSELLAKILIRSSDSTSTVVSANHDALPERTVLDVRAALAYVDADDRDTWVTVGMALHSESTHPDTFALWIEWSQRSAKYDAEDASRVWASFRTNPDGIRLGTVFALAKKGGFRLCAVTKPKAIQTPPQVARRVNAVCDLRTKEWKSSLLVNKKESILPRLGNYILFLQNHREFENWFQYDEFADRILCQTEEMRDDQLSEVRRRLERHIPNYSIPAQDVYEAVRYVAYQNRLHPVRQYLEGLQWDGVERLRHFFGDFCGCPNDAYHQGVAVAHFVSAVLRILQPGCQVDSMVVLESPQGWKKSSLWKLLYGDWYREMIEPLNSKDFFQGLRGVWCADFGEMHQIRKADVERYKQIITMRSDAYRPSYGRCVQTFLRQCIFVGGTNTDQWLTDHTGGRRFLPIKLGSEIKIDAVAAIRDQLFAEAAEYVSQITRATVSDRWLELSRWWDVPNAESHQMARLEEDAWTEMIEKGLADKSNLLRGATQWYVTVEQVMIKILSFCGRDMDAHLQARVRRCLERLGWESTTIRLQDQKSVRAWRLKADRK